MDTTDSVSLELPSSLLSAAETVAREDGTTLNHFIAAAVAEKLAALKTSDYLQERASRADLSAFDRLMSRPGGEPPRSGDEMPS